MKMLIICDSCSEEVLILVCYIHDGITDHHTLCGHQAVVTKQNESSDPFGELYGNYCQKIETFPIFVTVS